MGGTSLIIGLEVQNFWPMTFNSEDCGTGPNLSERHMEEGLKIPS